MFDNPFISFHDQVAEAKEERVQLNRLLTISTPKERLAVVVLFIVLLGLVGWLVFGDVSRTIALHGTVVEHSESSTNNNQFIQVLVSNIDALSSEIESGVPVSIEFKQKSSGNHSISGTLEMIDGVPLPQEWANLVDPLVVAFRIGITAEQSLDASDLGNKCTLVIEVGRQSPISLFGRRLL
ncbi:MAG: hypothetical protein OXC80_01525 [Gammaproteobacteria bacterium]|nr:hypothetical protein [Gammaproteobacteria bacterium]